MRSSILGRIRAPEKLFKRIFVFPKIQAFAQTIFPFLQAQSLIRFYYFSLLYVSVVFFPQWWDVSTALQTAISPLWPVSWIHLVGLPVAIYSIRLLFLVGALFAAFFPEQRLARMLAFVGLLEFVALYTSMWKLDVDWYVWILAAFLLIFLPNGWKDPLKTSLLKRQKFLLVFWGCQAIVLLTYSMSALGKVYGSFVQLFLGQVHSFAPQAAALHIADRLLTTNATSVFGPFIIQHPWVGWFFFVGATYLMFFAIWASFRFSIQRLWGIALILYHVGVYLTMNIGFSAHILLIAILFLNSPFREANTTWRTILFDLPLFGWIVKLYSNKNKAEPVRENIKFRFSRKNP